MKKRPNIIHLTAHDLGRHLGCYGEETVNSPHLDRMAEEGAILKQAFCAAPQCSPSRAAVFTGRYPHSNGTMGLTHMHFGWDLHKSEQHLAQVLKGSGYQTYLGSFQHESRRSFQGMGFDEALGIGGNAPTIGEKTAAWFPSQKDSDKPFYLQIAFSEPHRAQPTSYFGHPADTEKGVKVPPFLVDESTARDEFAFFQGSIKALDEGVGKILQGLKDSGLDEDTLVVFVSDHGMPFPRAKCTVYDPGLEIASLMRWPGGIKPGLVVEEMIPNVDTFPTMLELADCPLPDVRLEGRSFAARLREEPYEKNEAIFGEMTYHEYCDPIRCIRTETHKLIANFSTAESFMDSSQEWRPLTAPKHPENPRLSFHDPIELYDLEADPLETKNLAFDEKHADIRKDLLRRLREWMEETEDPLLQGIPVPPLYAMSMHALRTGEVTNVIEQVDGDLWRG